MRAKSAAVTRLIFCCLLSFACLPALYADALNARLRLLLPGEAPATVNERQFLYQRVTGLLRELEDDKLGRKSTKQKIARIQDRLRERYLRTYDAGARLPDAFRQQRYSDATAAILTALVLEYFDVDYHGFVDHWEAHLVADPDGRASPLYAPSHRKRREAAAGNFQRDYLALVRSTVAADLEARTAADAEREFQRYYYRPDRRLTFGQLSAYLLLRRAQEAYRNARYEDAIELLEGALRREERPAFLVLRRAAELQLAARDQTALSGDIIAFFRSWAEEPANNYFPAAILNHFDEEQRLLLAQQRPDLARRLLADYLRQAPPGQAEWARELRLLQQLRFLNHHYANGRLDLAKGIADSLHRADPANETVRYLLGELVIDDLRRAASGALSFARRVTDAAAAYPFIRKQDRFADLLLREQAWKVRDLYAQDRPDLAGPALERFRHSLLDIPIGRKRSLWTLTAFLAASNYHFRVEDYPGARRYLAEALRYAPEDPYLTHRRAVLERY